MQSLVIDTDVGTDCDDLFALTYALKNPDCKVEEISTVIGDTVVRAKIVRKLERMFGVEVPVIAGESGSIECVRKYWTGIEELALTDEEKKEEFVNSPYPVYSPETRLACIGPLTNIALQLRTNPTIANVKKVYVMGSSEKSHNFKADLDSWKIVLEQDWDIYQITKDVSEKVSFDRDELKGFRINPAGNFLYESAIRWLDHTKRERACMYDVLTLSSAIGETYVRFKEISSRRFLSYDVESQLKDKILEIVKND